MLLSRALFEWERYIGAVWHYKRGIYTDVFISVCFCSMFKMRKMEREGRERMGERKSRTERERERERERIKEERQKEMERGRG